MNQATLISPNEYLETNYDPDMDFVDGSLVERKLGTQRHGKLQGLLAVYFSKYRQSHRVDIFVETRLVVATHKYRIPDVMVVSKPYEPHVVIVDVPVIIVEIKSPDDTFDDIINRCFDYENLHVKNILVMDPDYKRAWVFHEGNLQILAGCTIKLEIGRQSLVDFAPSDIFVDLDV